MMVHPQALPPRIEEIRDLHERRKYREIIEILDGSSQIVEEPELALALASSLTYVFEHDNAREVLECARNPVFSSGDGFLIRRWQNMYAIRLIEIGHLAESKDLLSDCLAKAETARHIRAIGDASMNLGIIASLKGELVDALQFYMRSIAASQSLGRAFHLGRAHYNAGVLLREWGRCEAAVKHLELADDYYSREGTLEERVLTESERALVYLALGDLALAERLAQQAVSRTRLLRSNLFKAYSFKALGVIRLRRGGPLEARPVLRAALRAVAKTSSPIYKAEVHEEMAILELIAGDTEAAFTHRARALSGYRSMGMDRHADRFDGRFQQNTLAHRN